MMIIEIELIFIFLQNWKEKFSAPRSITLIAKTNIVCQTVPSPSLELWNVQSSPGLTGSRKKLVPFNYGNLYFGIFHSPGKLFRLSELLSVSQTLCSAVFFADCGRLNLFSVPQKP